MASHGGQTWLQTVLGEIAQMQLSKTARDRLEYTAFRVSKLDRNRAVDASGSGGSCYATNVDLEVQVREELSRKSLRSKILQTPLSGAKRSHRNKAQHQALDGSRLDHLPGHRSDGSVQQTVEVPSIEYVGNHMNVPIHKHVQRGSLDTRTSEITEMQVQRQRLEQRVKDLEKRLDDSFDLHAKWKELEGQFTILVRMLHRQKKGGRAQRERSGIR